MRAIVAALAICALPLAGSALADRDSFRRAMEQSQREAERAQREMEQRRRDAERERQEIERQRQEAERQRQQAERQTQTAIPQQQQFSTSRTSIQQSAPSSAASTRENAASGANNQPSTRTTDDDSDDTQKTNRNTAAAASSDDNLDAPPPTVEKLLQRWFAPGIKTPPQHPRPAGNRALLPWGTATKIAPRTPRSAARTAPRALAKIVTQATNKTAPVAIAPVGTAAAEVTAAPAAITATSAKVTTKVTQRGEGIIAKPSQQIHGARNTGQRRSGGRPPPIELNLPPAPQLLAVNATPDMIATARKLGFAISQPARLTRLKFSVTRLDVPRGMGTGEARSLLQRRFPGTSFAFNRRYRIYKTATGVDDAGNAAAGKIRGATPGCTADRCFAPKLIGWKRQLRRCASGTPIGIIDTSIDRTHPAFAGKKLEVAHFGNKEPAEPDWHGTGVAAILAGNSNSLTPGLIPDARFYLADVFHADEDGQPTSDTVSMLRAFDWLEAKGVKIINMSLTGPKDDLIQAAVAKLAAKGIVLVAAAGNDGPTAEPSYPAAYKQVIAVTAVNKNLHSYRYANRGSYIDVAAPGVGIWTALPGARQGFHSGTSFAAPYITATLATVIAANPHVSGAKLLDKLAFQDLGAPGPDPIYGKGLIQAPASCSTAGAIARASRPKNVPSDTTAAFAPATTSAGPEQLPWLSFSN